MFRLRSFASCFSRFAVREVSIATEYSRLATIQCVNVLQLCQARLLSSDKSKDDIPKAKPDHTARNVVIGAGVLAVGGAVYYVSKYGSPFGTDDGKQKPDAAQKPIAIELPKHAPYLVIGAGTAAYAAYRAIRAGDATAKVLLVGEERQLPYMRPPLSKELWFSANRDLVRQLKFSQWNGKERSIFYEKEGFYCQPKELPDQEFGGVAVALGQKVVRLDVKERVAYLQNGKSVTFDKCLIATGQSC